MMITSVDPNTFWKEVKDKNYLCLKVHTISSIKNDPTFERGETEEILKILDDNVPEIFEDEIKLDYEERLDRCDWDKRYFSRLNTWLQENFAKSRIQYIKEVGTVVHADTAEHYRKCLEQGKSQREAQNTAVNPTQVPEKKSWWTPRKCGIFAGVAALVLVIVFLIRLISK